MGEVIIKLHFDKETGKSRLDIDYESSDDTLRFEHERRHKKLVGDLLRNLNLDPDETEVVVHRVAPPQKNEETTRTPGREATRDQG